MPEQMPMGRSAEGLEDALHRLGSQVAVVTAPDYSALVRARLQIGPPPMSRLDPARRPARLMRPLAVAVALVVVLAVVLGVPRTRHAVADLFGIAGVEVHHDLPRGTPRTSLDQSLDLGEAATLAEARAGVPFPIALPSTNGLGSPDAVYIRSGLGLRSVNLVFRPGPGFPPSPGSHVGLLLSEYAGSAQPYFTKYLDQGIEVQQVTVGGQWPGLYFPGAQEVLVRDPVGAVHDVRPRLSAPSLVWVDGDVTYRLEAGITRTRALAIAAGLR